MLGDEFFERDVLRAVDGHFGPQQAQVLIQIPKDAKFEQLIERFSGRERYQVKES